MKSPRQAGFTLIEVLVALAILSIAVVACIEGFAQGLRLLRVAGDHQRAILIADQKAREVVDIRQESQEQGVEGPFYWERTLSPIVAPDLVPATGQPAWRLYQIAVRVGWERRVIEVRTLRMVSIAGATGVAAATPGGSGLSGGGSGSSSTGLGSLLGGGQTGTGSAAIGSLLGTRK